MTPSAPRLGLPFHSVISVRPAARGHLLRALVQVRLRRSLGRREPDRRAVREILRPRIGHRIRLRQRLGVRFRIGSGIRLRVRLRIRLRIHRRPLQRLPFPRQLPQLVNPLRHPVEIFPPVRVNLRPVRRFQLRVEQHVHDRLHVRIRVRRSLPCVVPLLRFRHFPLQLRQHRFRLRVHRLHVRFLHDDAVGEAVALDAIRIAFLGHVADKPFAGLEDDGVGRGEEGDGEENRGRKEGFHGGGEVYHRGRGGKICELDFTCTENLKTLCS
ncbi:MAG: hypothetical protein FD180_848 [Planctomycetota bacterium]|nr:MAG: hypothetical protein FD180_848 [Planctomycetota bacterium]